MPLFRDIPHALATTLSTMTSTLRGWRGSMQRVRADRPTEYLELYEFEGCPYCRLVREVLTEISMDVVVYPCPPGGRRFRPRAHEAAGGRATFPFLVDPNRGAALPESRDIIAYLYEHYTDQPASKPGVLSALTSGLASIPRAGKGVRARPSRAPDELLELWSFESSPFCRLVRERLSELELPYILRQVPKEQASDLGTSGFRIGGVKQWKPVPGGIREELIARGGTSQVPFLVDANTGEQMYESADILDYLDAAYGR